MKNSTLNQKGTSLIEIIIAVFIIACAFIPILRLVDYGSVSTAKIGNYAKATRLAQELIEEFKHVPFKVINDTYKDFPVGEWRDEGIPESYYSETQRKIEEFRTEGEKTKSVKDFDCKTKVKIYKNDFDQINEIWLEVEIGWYDMGTIEKAKGTKRLIKVANAYHNAEAIY